MKKPIFLITAILTISLAACLSGCATSGDDKTTGLPEQRIVTADDGENGDRLPDIETPDDNDGEDNKRCPDGNCKRKGPHTRLGGRRKKPTGLIPKDFKKCPDCKHDRRLPDCRGDKPEQQILPSEENNG